MHDATTYSIDSVQLLSETSQETHDGLVDCKTQVRLKGHHRYVGVLHSRHVYTLHSSDLQCRVDRTRLRWKIGRSIPLPLSVYSLDKLDLDIPNDCDRYLNSSAEQDHKRSWQSATLANLRCLQGWIKIKSNTKSPRDGQCEEAHCTQDASRHIHPCLYRHFAILLLSLQVLVLLSRLQPQKLILLASQFTFQHAWNRHWIYLLARTCTLLLLANSICS